MPRSTPKIIKCVVLGDGAVGKTCLLISYCVGKFPKEYIPTAFENYSKEIHDAEGHPYIVAFWDTAGGEDYHRLRPLSYPETDIFLICFDISNRDSFDNIESYWIPELDHHIPEAQRLIVGCKADLREPYSNDDSLVTYGEAMELAKELGTSYVETSAKDMKGLDMCFMEALRLTNLGDRVRKKKEFFSDKFMSRLRRQVKTPPVLPRKEKTPHIALEPSTFSDDWQKALEESTHTDVIFVTDTKHQLKADKVVLYCASDFFCNLFDVKTMTTEDMEKVTKKLTDDKTCSDTEDLVDQGPVPGVTRMFTQEADDKSYEQTVIELGSEVTTERFAYVLQFMYTGVPRFPDDITEVDLDKVISLCQCFELPLLEMFCNNLKEDEAYLNPSISSYHMETVGRRMKQFFINNMKFSDVVFKVNDVQIYAHKCVLTTRSKVMAAMLSGTFKEGNSTFTEIEIPDTAADTFLALLEYLYTDRAPLETVDPVDVLVLADQYCLSRLITLCEEYITHSVTDSDSKKTPQTDVINMLRMSRMYNACQLEKWCLHYISINYSAFKSCKEFLALDDTSKQYAEEHQWPPLSYLEELEESKNPPKKSRKCTIM